MIYIKRILVALVLTALSIAVLMSGVAFYFIATPQGGKLLAGYVLKKYALVANISVGSYEGTIAHGFILKDIELKDWPALPSAVIRLQQARVQIPMWDLRRISVDILNARISLPQSDPIVFNGSINNGVIKGNIYAGSLEIHELALPFIAPEINKDLQGYATDVDLVIKGPLASPQVVGRFFIDNVHYKTTTVSDAFGRMDLVVSPVLGQWQLKGEAFVDSGLVIARHVILDLQKSKVIFKDDVNNPNLDIRTGTRIDDIDISLIIKGSLLKPELRVISDPPIPEDVALVVLATGRSWSTSAMSLSKGSLSGELMGDFMDYFLLGGRGGEFARQYGLSDFAMQYDDQSKKIGLKKKLTEDFRVGVELEQMPPQAGTTSIYSKKLEGELELADHLSVNVSKVVLPQDNNAAKDAQEINQQGEAQIYLKYKKNF